jgi:hypothetical protein
MVISLYTIAASEIGRHDGSQAFLARPFSALTPGQVHSERTVAADGLVT